MTRTQLKNALLAKDQVLSIAKEFPAEPQPDGVNRYRVNLKIQTSEGAINYKNEAYYVEDEGEAGETAYWENSEPFKVNNVVSFSSQVYNKIAQAVTAGQIKGAIVDKSDETSKTAQVTAYKTDPNSAQKVVIVNYMVRDNDGTIELAEITN